jgi:hypothetical protein
LAFAGHRKENYIDGDQNDPANDQNHLFGKHKASLTLLTRGMAKFRNAGMMGSMISNKPENDCYFPYLIRRHPVIPNSEIDL